MSSPVPNHPKVFISYSHESREHIDRVLALADHLRAEGIDCTLDQYEVSPPESWPEWRARQIREADFVLVICTETYKRCFEGEEIPSEGYGVRFEGHLIYQHIYNAGTLNPKFIPVLLELGKFEHIPTLLGTKPYEVSTEEGYKNLYRHLTNQPSIIKPILGEPRQLPPRERKLDFARNTPLQPYVECDIEYRNKVEELVCEGHGKVPPSRRGILDKLRNDLDLSLERTDAIEAKARQTYLEYRSKVEELVRENYGEISHASYSILEILKEILGISLETATAIEDEILQPYLEYRAKVEEFVREDGGKLSPDSRSTLDRLRGALSLLPEAATAIEKEILQPYKEYRAKVEEFVWDGYGKISSHNRNTLQALRDRLKILSEVAMAIEKEVFSQLRRRLLRVLFTSWGVALGVLLIRLPGFLQPVELSLYDCLMQWRPTEQDNRFLIIEIGKEDIEAQVRRQENRIYSLSDFSLDRLLKKLDKYEPVAIGLDIYRTHTIKSDIPPNEFKKIGDKQLSVKEHHDDLIERLKRQGNLFAVCKVLNSDEKGEGNPPPPDLLEKQGQERVGFSDVVVDKDGVVRRHLLALDPDYIANKAPDQENPCVVKNAFSFVLAAHYLKAIEKITYKLEMPKEKFWKLKFSNGVVFSQFSPFTGGYQNEGNYGGYQVLLNYRSPQSIPKSLHLDDVLSDRVSISNTLKGRIILIGVTDRDINDYWATPYGATLDRQMSGVVLQAQMVSQIISAVKRERPLLWVWSREIEFFWFWFWSFVGGILAWFFRLPLFFILAMSLAVFTLCVSCFLVFWLLNGWLPLFPPALGLSATGMLAYWFLQRPILDDKTGHLNSES